LILTRSPFRVTLGGGGTDLPSYFSRHGGFVLAMGLDKYMYISLNVPLVDRMIRVQYMRSEMVDHPDQLKHELAREALKRYEIFAQIEITSTADLPAGSGLGSSSCYLVGLLAALRAYRRRHGTLLEMAEEAAAIELGVLRQPIGKEDQFMAVFGGMSVLEIARDGAVRHRYAAVPLAVLPDFVANVHLYWTGIRRSGPEVLRDQFVAMDDPTSPSHPVVEESLHAIKELGHQSLAAIEAGNFDEFGQLMDKHWGFKKRMSPRITIPGIDELYAVLKSRFGVLGAKVAGPGGGGFVMVYAPGRHAEVTRFMAERGLKRLHYNVEFEGVKVIANTTPYAGGYTPEVVGHHSARG
jgi:D-glycero-alpha-D-manno-heptose-7-phosphate kinase